MKTLATELVPGTSCQHLNNFKQPVINCAEASGSQDCRIAKNIFFCLRERAIKMPSRTEDKTVLWLAGSLQAIKGVFRNKLFWNVSLWGGREWAVWVLSKLRIELTFCGQPWFTSCSVNGLLDYNKYGVLNLKWLISFFSHFHTHSYRAW